MVEDASARNMETVHRVGEAQGDDDTWKGIHLGIGVQRRHLTAVDQSRLSLLSGSAFGPS